MKVNLTKLLRPELKIQTIKNLRTATGLGLKEAKEIVDSMANTMSIHEVEIPGSHVFSILREVFDFEEQKAVKSHRDLAEEHLREYAKELIDRDLYDSATSVTNLLSLLMKTEIGD